MWWVWLFVIYQLFWIDGTSKNNLITCNIDGFIEPLPSVSYSKSQLLTIRESMQKNIMSKKLPPGAIRTIRSLKLNKTKKRHRKPKHNENKQFGPLFPNLKYVNCNSNGNKTINIGKIQIATINVRSVKSKQSLI